MKAIKTFLSLRAADKMMGLEAASFLFLTRLVILFLPYSALRKMLGRHRSIAVNQAVDEAKVRRISYFINRIAPRMPIECTCLPKALTGKYMLHRRGIKSTLYLGLGPHDTYGMMGHAWLMVNHLTVTGGSGNEKLAQVGHFGSD